MDRKNKKAAQHAAASAAPTLIGSEKGVRKKRDGQSGNSNSALGRNNTLLAGGSTAPTRLLSPTSSAPASNRSLLPLKASISPSAPAPPLKDTDFASFAALDEMEGVQLSAPPAHGKSPTSEAGASSDASKNGDGQLKTTPSPVPLPMSAPRVTTTMAPSDFGPIGSPPSASRGYRSGLTNGTFTPGNSPRRPTHPNGVNLDTSPQNTAGLMSTSPFSAPGSQSVFINSSYAGQGVAASLGSGLAMGARRGWVDMDASASPVKGGLSMLPSSVQRPSLRNGDVDKEYPTDLDYKGAGLVGRKFSSAVEDGDMEDFIPGSLTDLLTPEERSRRMSKGGSNTKPLVSALTAGAPSNSASDEQAPTPIGSRSGHRHSSSVPAPSFLGDTNSIWSGTSVGPLSGSPSVKPSHRATPSVSFASRFEGLAVGGQQTANDFGVSISTGSTGAASSFGVSSLNNASAAFLGLHHRYQKNKASQQMQLGIGGADTNGLSRGVRGASGPLYPSGKGTMSSNRMGAHQGFPSSANAQSTLSQLPSYRGAPSPFDLTQPMHQTHNQLSRPIPTLDYNSRPALGNSRGVRLGGGGGGGGGTGQHGMNGGGAGNGANGGGVGGLEGDIVAGQLLSPNTRALQAHAPGQSLPQGLAAGYSRIHALPPLANLTSPNAGGGLFPSSVADNSLNGITDVAVSSGLGSTTATTPGANVPTSSMTSAPLRGEWSALLQQTSPLTGPSTRNIPNIPTPAPGNKTPTGPRLHANVTSTSGFASGVASPGFDSFFPKLNYSVVAKGGSVSSGPTPAGLMKGTTTTGRYVCVSLLLMGSMLKVCLLAVRLKHGRMMMSYSRWIIIECMIVWALRKKGGGGGVMVSYIIIPAWVI